MQIWLMAISVTLFIGSEFSSAQSAKWQELVRNQEVKWDCSNSKFNCDKEKGVVFDSNYRVEIQKDDAGVVKTVTDLIRRDVPSSERNRDAEKSSDSYDIRRVHVGPQGDLRVLTTCQGERRLSTTFAMFSAIFSKSPGLGNSRKAICSTVTPQFCTKYRAALTARFGKDFSTVPYARACMEFSKDMNATFTDVMKDYPLELAKSEADAAADFLKRGMSAGAIDYSGLNLTHALVTTPPKERSESLVMGLGMFQEMMTLEQQCASPLMPSLGWAKQADPKSGTATVAK